MQIFKVNRAPVGIRRHAGLLTVAAVLTAALVATTAVCNRITARASEYDIVQPGQVDTQAAPMVSQCVRVYHFEHGQRVLIRRACRK